MLYPEMRPVEKTPSVGRPTKPKPAPVSPPPPPPAQAPPVAKPSSKRNSSASSRDDSKDNGHRQQPASSQPVKVEYAPDIKEFPDDLAASGAVTFLPHGSDEAPLEIALWHDNIPLTPGQEQHVNHLLHVETDILAREVLITVKREGMPPRSQWRHFMTQYALWSWYAESDALAWATLAKIEYSDWDEMLGFADEEHVETVAQDSAYVIAPQTDPPKLIVRPEKQKESSNSQPIGQMHISGVLTIYPDQYLDEPLSTFPKVDPSVPYSVYQFSDQNPTAALIGFPGWEYWINISDPATVLEMVVYKGQSEEYELQSIVGDEEEVPVALSHGARD